jgi:hypothetical protein
VKGGEFIDFITTVSFSRIIIPRRISWLWKTHCNVDGDAIYIRCVVRSNFTEMVLLNVILRRVPKALAKKILLPSSCLTIRLHGTKRLPADEFYWNFIFEVFTEIYSHLLIFSTIGKNNTVRRGLCTFIAYRRH